MKEKEMTYKIEGRGEGGDWAEDCVGRDSDANTFLTEEEAEEMIPELARIFECGSEDFRIVEREANNEN